jgi:TolA-binding protein
MKFRIFCLLAVLIAFIPTTGFVCATRVEKMEADIAALQLQFTEIQKRVNNDQTQLTEMILRADKKLEELGSTQDQTHDRVAQQNIQLALELEQERNELANMRGRLDLQQKTIDELQASLQTVMGSVASTTGGNSIILPSEQEALYAFIGEKRTANDTAAQKAAILEFIKRYPSDTRIEAILAELIMLLSTENAHTDAISYAARYLQLFPKSPSRNEIIYIMGDSGLKIGNCDLAQKSFQTLEALSYRDASARFKDAKANCKK